MNENLDLTKILEGCPKGTTFYSPVLGRCSFLKIIHPYNEDEIVIETEESNGINTHDLCNQFSFSKEGYLFLRGKRECMLYPSKTCRDWAKFERFWDKPKVERFDPKTFQPFDKVICRDDKQGYWHVDLFSHRRDNSEFNYECLGSSFKCCIPFNEETKHLVGTKDDCPEYYKWWEE